MGIPCSRCLEAHKKLILFSCQCICHSIKIRVFSREDIRMIQRIVFETIKKMQDSERGEYEKMMDDEIRQKKINSIFINWEEIDRLNNEE